jgi:hypothetical protein
MVQATTRPNVPVFVSSTFNDLQVYRRKIQDAMTQLETIVRGMEQFGSRPGTPVEECLKAVGSCKLYVGVFGMRYGSIPDGYQKSMTNIEYDEAQRLKLPSLVYLLNEEHPIPAKDVEVGAGAEKLAALKDHLKKHHTVSFFTTPEDLQSRIMHDVPAQLSGMGVSVSGELAPAEEASDKDVLLNFRILPKLFSGRQVTVDFSLENVRAADTNDCASLGLEHGASVASLAKIDLGQHVYVYGERDIALALIKLPKGSVIKARANTVFGTSISTTWTEDGPLAETQAESGLVITEILNVEPPPL